jgi:hypothetical protein
MAAGSADWCDDERGRASALRTNSKPSPPKALGRELLRSLARGETPKAAATDDDTSGRTDPPEWIDYEYESMRRALPPRSEVLDGDGFGAAEEACAAEGADVCAENDAPVIAAGEEPAWLVPPKAAWHAYT